MSKMRPSASIRVSFTAATNLQKKMLKIAKKNSGPTASDKKQSKRIENAMTEMVWCYACKIGRAFSAELRTKR